MWDINELTLTCIECRWQLAFPLELFLWGWWAKEELAT